MTDELYHHGILGQKWGVRRYQNKDGTYTEAGKKRRRTEEISDEELRSSLKRAQLERRYAVAKTRPSKAQAILKVGSQGVKTAGNLAGLAGTVSELDTKNLKKTGDQVSKIGDASGKIAGLSRRPKKYDLSDYDDAELERLVQRAELEKQYDSIVRDSSFNEGMETANNVLAAVGSTLTIATASLTLYKMLKEMD